MTDSIDISKVKQELVVFIRNSDIFTTTQRGVTNVQDTGTWTGATSHLINRTNVKNIREITVDASPLTLGTDYTADYDFDDSGTIKCKITLVSAQTGSYSIDYDYGSDSIFPDFPRTDLEISSFPRIGFDIVSLTTEYGGLGNVLISDMLFTIICYGPNVEDIQGYISAIRTAVIAAQTSFYYLGYIRPDSIGPILDSPREIGKDKIFQMNIDIIGEWKYEVN